MVKPLYNSDLKRSMCLITRGKVRDVYKIDDERLLFVATDRISAYDVIMRNPIPNKGILLTLLATHWFKVLKEVIPGLRTHFLTLELPAQVPGSVRSALQNRSMQVRRCKVFPIEAIVRGYITGSAWKEYQVSGTVHGINMPLGLRESERFPNGPIYTPSTKAEAGEHDENIHPDQAIQIIGPQYAARIATLAVSLYEAAHAYALARGLIIADTKFEFGLDEETDEIVLVDEVLTPDSSRFWQLDAYQVGQAQESFDKQCLRDWLVSKGLKGKEGVVIDEDVVVKTEVKYREAYEMITGEKYLEQY